MKYPVYKKYVESNVSWLVKIPEHFEVKRLKNVVKTRTEKTENTDYQYIGLENIQSWTGKIITLNDFHPEGIANRFYSGDVLFGKLRPYLAKAAISSFDGICSTEIIVLNPVGINKKYLLYLILSNGFIDVVDSSTYGSKMPRASWDFIGNILIPIPTLTEQLSISAFLDRETARIDALIEKKKKLIELLKEKRTALITRAVTKGLNKEVKMKPSGIEWLGDIPEHWEVKRLKGLSQIITSNVDKKSYDDEIQVLLCNYTDVYNNEIIDINSDFMIATAKREEIRKFSLRPGDVIITKDSESWDDIAVPAFAPQSKENLLCGYHLAIIRANDSVVFGKYLFRCFQSDGIKNQFEVSASGVTRYGLPQYAVKNALFPLPALKEQMAISDYIDRNTETIKFLNIKLNEAISKLQEYRTVLISAAVTGKIRVGEE